MSNPKPSWMSKEIKVEGDEKRMQDLLKMYGDSRSRDIQINPMYKQDGGQNLTTQLRNFQYDKKRNKPFAQYGLENKYTLPYRDGVRLNYDEEGNVIGESSHIMRTETLDGKNWFSFRTLFQDEDGTWIDMSKEKN